jgi:hypothetical protein
VTLILKTVVTSGIHSNAFNAFKEPLLMGGLGAINLSINVYKKGSGHVGFKDGARVKNSPIG